MKYINTNQYVVELNDFLNDHPELAEKLFAAAAEYAEKKRKTEELIRRRREIAEAVAGFDKAIFIAQQSVNKLKGDILCLQKSRKAAVEELRSVVCRIESEK